MDKNPEQRNICDFEEAKRLVFENKLSILYFQQPFVKESVIISLMKNMKQPVIVIDFDLLYSGFVNIKLVSQNNVTKIYRPTKENLQELLSEVLVYASNNQCYVVIDSLNGFHLLLDDTESGRLTHAYIMLLLSVTKNLNSKVVLCTVSKKNEEGSWVLSPTSRNIPVPKNSIRIHFENENKIFLIE